MTAAVVALSLIGFLLPLVGAVYLVRSTRQLRATGTSDPGLGGPRGLALAAVLVGLAMAGAASFLAR